LKKPSCYVRYGVFALYVGERRGFRNRDVGNFFKATAVELHVSPDIDLEPFTDQAFTRFAHRYAGTTADHP